MAKVIVKTVQAYSKEDAIAQSGLTVKYDASTAWKNEEKPAVDSTRFRAFAEEYLEKKIKSVAGVACSITVESGVADSRERPYKVTNLVTDKPRKYTTKYEGLINGNDEGTTGSIVLTALTKAEAEAQAKAYMTANKTGRVVVRLAKTVSDGKPVALVVDYAPSKSTSLGTYIFFVIEEA